MAVLTEQSVTSMNKAAELAHRIAQQSNCLPSASWSIHTGSSTQALATTIATVQTAEKAKCTVLAQGLTPCFRMNAWGLPKEVLLPHFSGLPQVL